MWKFKAISTLFSFVVEFANKLSLSVVHNRFLLLIDLHAGTSAPQYVMGSNSSVSRSAPLVLPKILNKDKKQQRMNFRDNKWIYVNKP